MSPCQRDIFLAVKVKGQKAARPNLLFPMWDRRNRVAFTRTVLASIHTLDRRETE